MFVLVLVGLCSPFTWFPRILGEKYIWHRWFDSISKGRGFVLHIPLVGLWPGLGFCGHPLGVIV